MNSTDLTELLGRSDDNYSNERECSERCRRREQHVHEILGSTQSAERCRDCHNHRFATVSGEAIKSGSSHVHRVKFNTDSYDGHCHEFEGTSGPAIMIPNSGGRHIHYINACTKESDGHKHEFRVATLIENPTEDECNK